MTLISDFLENSSRNFPKKTALIYKDTKYTYQELQNEVKKKSLFFSKFQKNSVISLLFENSPEFIISYLGILKSACVAHIVPPNISTSNLREQIISTNPVSIVSSHELFPKLSIIENPKIEQIEYSEIKSRYAEERTADVLDYAYLIYTSGTTSKAKGVPITHQNSVFTTNNIVKILNYNNSDIDVLPLPLSHSFGLGCLHTSICVGSTLILHKNMINTAEIFSSMNEYSATTFAAVPASLTKLTKYQLSEITDVFKNLRLIMTNSTSIPSNTIKEYKKILEHGIIATYYGLTEASRSTFMIFDNDEKFNSVGTPPDQVEIRINNETNSESGEIWIKGPNVIQKYWNNPEADSNLENNWLRTGDLGKLDENGYLYLLGRLDDIINIGGEKLLPQDIESVVKVLSDVEEAVAIPMKHETFGNTVKLLIKKTNYSKITKTEILSYCIKNLERYKIPTKIEFVDDFPKTSYGKIKRFMLK
ncbi:MAG: acyl--CoA ligase [Candidatus Nitrosopelagicus sp.]|nr:acyl--CoA ligase [Candidatus Nitrosopelagicus sp.]